MTQYEVKGIQAKMDEYEKIILKHINSGLIETYKKLWGWRCN